ncbi:hypothetical protein IT575_01110 [bacterium]|nr:hypothetical protein [bacterium]
MLLSRSLLGLAAVFLSLLALGCGRLPLAGGTPVSAEVVKDISFTPPLPQPGETVLIKARVATRTIHVEGGITADAQEPEFRSSAGEFVPLLPDFYSPADPPPSFEAAKAELPASHNPPIPSYSLFGARIGDAYYFLLRIPGEQPAGSSINVSFNGSGGGGFYSESKEAVLWVR